MIDLQGSPTRKILDAVTTLVKSATCYFHALTSRTFQVTLKGTGAVTCTVIIRGSNTGVAGEFVDLATVTLSGTDSASDGFYLPAPWRYYEAEVTELSGTSANVTVTMGH